jgi:hypothetical protein
MLDTDADTKLIDEKKKKKETDEDSYTSRVKSFVLSVARTILFIICYFIGGAILLFSCKLAQSNILPTNTNCSPYTDTDSSINPNPIKTNIFTTLSFTEPTMSMKLEIPYDINSRNQLIDMCKKWKESKSASFLGNYFISITEQLLQFNYSSITSIMNFMNSNLPEIVIVFLGPLISVFIYFFKIFMNIGYFIYVWFAQMGWFFKKNKNESQDKKPEWEDVWLIATPFNWYCGFLLICLFAFLWPIFIFLPMICYNYSLFSILFYKGILNGEEISAFTIIKETFKYYKVTIVSIISLWVILLAFSKLGNTITLSCIIVTFFLFYFDFISTNYLKELFKPIPEKNLSPVEKDSYVQAKKTCDGNIAGKNYGYLRTFFNLLTGQKGGSIANELRSVGKTLA